MFTQSKCDERYEDMASAKSRLATEIHPIAGAKKGWRLLPYHWWIRRWSRLKGLSLKQKLLRIPIAAIAASMDLVVFIAAIRDVHRGRAFGYWGRGVISDH